MISVLPLRRQKFEEPFVGYTSIGAIDFSFPHLLRERTRVLQTSACFRSDQDSKGWHPDSRSRPEMG